MQTQQTPQVLQQPFAAQGDKNTIPNAATGTNKASLQEGFPPITGQPINQGGIPPERQDFNGAMNLNSQFYFAFQNGWWPTFTQEVSDAIGGYPQGAVLWLFDTENNVYTPLLSLVGNNTYNFNTNKDYIGQYWAKILPDSGRGLPLGAIYFSSSSNADDNPGALPLWSGEYYTNASTLYPAFYAWVKSHTELCKSKTEYDSAISTYGECPYYVVDEVAGSLRLPKLVNYLKMANATDGVTQAQAGLPNITGEFGYFSRISMSGYLQGAFYESSTSYPNKNIGGESSATTGHAIFDASRSSSIYGKSSTVTPAHTTVYPWVVVTASDAESSAVSAAQSADQAATSAINASNSAEAAAQSAQAAASSASLADIQNKITNCITKIPQDIKLTLVDGVLTLKAGSRVYDSSGAVTNITADRALSISNMSSAVDYFLFAYTTSDKNNLRYFNSSQIFSGSTVPTFSGSHCVWYDTASQQIKYTDDGGSSWNTDLSFPLARFSADGATVTSVNQVFNGFGYIGQVLFALPGVEGLSPNGRNEDGSLKNELMVLDHVVTRDYTWDCANGQYVFLGISQENGDDFALISTSTPGKYKQQSTPPALDRYITWHRLDENKLYRTEALSDTPNWVSMRGFAVGPVFNSGEGTNISSWNIACPMSMLDMSNTSYLSKMGMPSDRYFDLTLGASGANYTAPANGYFCITAKASEITTEYILSSVIPSYGGRIPMTTWRHVEGGAVVPIKAGQTVQIYYQSNVTMQGIRFVFAEGDK